MYNWEQIRSEVPFPQVYTVPTALERAGDFSQTRTADGRPITIYDPLTTRSVERAVRARPVPRQRDPGEPDRSGRARHPAACAAAERVRPGQQSAGARERARRPLRPARRQGRSGAEREPPILRAVRAQQANRDQRLRRVPAGSLAVVSARPHERRPRRRADVGAVAVAPAELARRLHAPRFLHPRRMATTSIRASSASRRGSSRSCRATPSRRSSGRDIRRSAARSAAIPAASSPSATPGRGRKRSARWRAITR